MGDKGDMLERRSDDARLAVLLERGEQTKAFTESTTRTLAGLTDSVYRIERAQITLTDRADANALAITNLNKLVDHKEGTSISRDKIQTDMIHAEEDNRQQAITAVAADLNSKFDALADEVHKLKDKIGDMVVVSRVTVFLVGAASVALVGGFVTGHISLAFH